MPNSIAAAFNVASFNKTPKRLNGSASPRNAEPIALMASSGVVLLKLARSADKEIKSVVNVANWSPAKPAALPNVPNVPAAAKTWF